ncbi:hypothetical protein MOV76_17300 [Rhizobium sp. PRIMUS64]|uniref:hypothetical protein n=1 Tax=Rhizobium sp. PRIMUS64 TaxID=2908925 RepID=UPI001FF3A487|nr:hypothetical protein [Rhizobium sp. PRIMUS64]MCJ9693361.1 hypothetical protein [Rhizobium sp. PRIMUS64]
MPKFHHVKRLYAYLLIVAAMLLSVGTASAAITEESGRRVALVIGNSVYKTLPSLPNPANGAVKIDKSFCMQTKAVTRAEMAEYYTANSDPAAAQAYADNPQQPADDVPLAVAQNYTAWLSKQLNAPVHLPSATEWMASATKITTEKLPDNGDIILQWSATPCEAGGNVAFMAQEGSTFVVCSDASAGGIFRVTAELR